MLNGWEQDIDDELNAGEYHLFDGKWPIEKEDDLPMKKSDVREQTLEFPDGITYLYIFAWSNPTYCLMPTNDKSKLEVNLRSPIKLCGYINIYTYIYIGFPFQASQPCVIPQLYRNRSKVWCSPEVYLNETVEHCFTVIS
jgi:hypothetical protein